MALHFASITLLWKDLWRLRGRAGEEFLFDFGEDLVGGVAVVFVVVEDEPALAAVDLVADGSESLALPLLFAQASDGGERDARAGGGVNGFVVSPHGAIALREPIDEPDEAKDDQKGAPDILLQIFAPAVRVRGRGLADLVRLLQPFLPFVNFPAFLLGQRLPLVGLAGVVGLLPRMLALISGGITDRSVPEEERSVGDEGDSKEKSLQFPSRVDAGEGHGERQKNEG